MPNWIGIRKKCILPWFPLQPFRVWARRCCSSQSIRSPVRVGSWCCADCPLQAGSPPPWLRSGPWSAPWTHSCSYLKGPAGGAVTPDWTGCSWNWTQEAQLPLDGLKDLRRKGGAVSVQFQQVAKSDCRVTVASQSHNEFPWLVFCKLIIYAFYTFFFQAQTSVGMQRVALRW